MKQYIINYRTITVTGNHHITHLTFRVAGRWTFNLLTEPGWLFPTISSFCAKLTLCWLLLHIHQMYSVMLCLVCAAFEMLQKDLILKIG